MSNQPQDFNPQIFKEFERTGWDEVAPSFDSFAGRLSPQSAEPLLDAVGAGNHTRLLDVACGPGYIAAAGAARGARVTGVDFAPAMVAEAVRRNPDIEFREGDAEALPFDEASFDAVVCNLGFLHFGDPDRAIAEACRVLTSGGRYAFTTWATPDRMAYMGVVTGALMAHGNMDVGLPAAPPPFRFADADESKRSLIAAGFADPEVAEITIVGTFTVPELVESLSTGTVRSKALMEAQSEEAREKIRAAIAENAKPFEKNGKIELPMVAVLSSATKP